MNSSERVLTDVPRQVRESFLEKLAETDLPPETLGLLRQVLEKQGAPTERSIRAALFGVSEPEI